MDSFFTGSYKTIRNPDELLLEVIALFQSLKTYCGLCKLGKYKVDFNGMISVAVALQMGNVVCKKATIILGDVVLVPLLTQKANAMLEDKKMDDTLIQKVATALLKKKIS